MRRSESGQTATEYMLLIAVLVIAVVGGAYAFVPSFRGGTEALAADTSTILDGGKIDAAGVSRGPGAGRSVGPSGNAGGGPIGGNGCAGGGRRGTGCDQIQDGGGTPLLGQPVAPDRSTTGSPSASDGN